MIQTLFGSVEQEPSLLERLKSGVQKTRAGLVKKLEDAVSGRKEIDADVLDELEYALITADIGVEDDGRDSGANSRTGRAPSGGRCRRAEGPDPRVPAGGPGSDRAARAAGGRAARRDHGGGRERRGQDHVDRQAGAALQAEGRSVLLCAADTFRAAAIEQLEIWGERTGTQVIRQQPGQRPERGDVRRAAGRARRARSIT